MKEPVLLELLYAALASPLGVVVETSDPVTCKAKLYELRKQDPAFERLSFLVSPTAPTTSFWIVKKGPSDENPPDESHPEPS